MKQIIRDNKWLFALMGFFITASFCFALTAKLVPHADARVGGNESFADLTMAAAEYFNKATADTGTNDPCHMKQLTQYLGFNDDFADAGCFLGYADPTSTIFGAGSQTGKDGTTYGIQKLYWLDNIERISDTHGGSTNEVTPFSAYVYYGRALSLCGFDETFVYGQKDNTRFIIGMLMLAMYIASVSINLFFEFVLTILIYANPFRLFVDVVPHVVASDIMNVDSALNGSSIASAVTAGLNTLADIIRGFYNLIQSMSIVVILPIFFATFVFSWLVLNKGRNFWSSAKKFIIRSTFVVLGVPIMFAIYDASLQLMKNTLSVKNAYGSTVVLSTFLDFKNWAIKYNLGVPHGSTATTPGHSGGSSFAFPIQYDYVNDTLGSMCSSNLRTTCLGINSAVRNSSLTGVVTAYTGYSTGNVAKLSQQEQSMWNTTFSDTSADDMNADQISDIMNLLLMYAMGDEVTSGEYEGMATGMAESTIAASKKNGFSKTFFYGSAFIADDFDYEKIKSPDGARFKRATDSSSITLTQDQVSTIAKMRFRWQKWPSSTGEISGGQTGIVNMWHDGHVSFSMTGNVLNFKSTLDTSGIAGKGLSTIAMYNYLNSSFSSEGVLVQTSDKNTSVDGKFYHYAVTSIGTGLMKIFYLLDSLIILSCVGLVGYGYALALLFANLKSLFQMIPKVMRGMYGSMAGIAAALALTFSLCLNVILTGLLYTVAIDILRAVFKIVESPLSMLFENVHIGTATAGIANILQPVFGLLSIIIMVYITRSLLRWRRAVIAGATEASTKFINNILQTQVRTPDLSSPADNLGGKVLNAASMAGGLAMAGQLGAFGGLGDAGSKLVDNSAYKDLAKKFKNDEGTGILDKIQDAYDANGVEGVKDLASDAFNSFGIGGTGFEATDKFSNSQNGASQTDIDNGEFGVYKGSYDPSKQNQDDFLNAYKSGELEADPNVKRDKDAKRFDEMNGEELARAYQNGELKSKSSNRKNYLDNLSRDAVEEADRNRQYEEAKRAKDNANKANKLTADSTLPRTDADAADEYVAKYENWDSDSDDIVVNADGKNVKVMQGEDKVSVEKSKNKSKPVENNNNDKFEIDDSTLNTKNSYLVDHMSNQNGKNVVIAADGTEYEVTDSSKSRISSKDGSGKQLVIDNNGNVYGVMEGTAHVKSSDGTEYVVDSHGEALKVTNKQSNGKTVYVGNDGSNYVMDNNNNSYKVSGGTTVVSRDGNKCIFDSKGDAYALAPNSNRYQALAGGGGQHVINAAGDSYIIAKDNNAYKVDESNSKFVVDNKGQHYQIDRAGDVYTVQAGSPYVTSVSDGKTYTINDGGNATVVATGGSVNTVVSAPSGGSTQAWRPGASYVPNGTTTTATVRNDVNVVDDTHYSYSGNGSSNAPVSGGSAARAQHTSSSVHNSEDVQITNDISYAQTQTVNGDNTFLGSGTMKGQTIQSQIDNRENVVVNNAVNYDTYDSDPGVPVNTGSVASKGTQQTSRVTNSQTVEVEDEVSYVMKSSDADDPGFIGSTKKGPSGSGMTNRDRM